MRKDEERLRFVVPWSKANALTLLEAPGSPMYFEGNVAEREHIYFCAGGVLRMLGSSVEHLRMRRVIASKTQLNLGDLHGLVDKTREELGRSTMRFLQDVPASEAASVAANFLPLVRGDVSWTFAKGLYDKGCVAFDDPRPGADRTVHPVSRAAEAALCGALSKWFMDHRAVSLPSLDTNGKQHADELERQVLACLTACDRPALASLQLRGSPSAALAIDTDFALTFGAVGDLVPQEGAVLYRPRADNYAFDAAIVPPVDADPSVPVIIVEVSIADPRDAGRVDKVLAWFKSDGIISELRSVPSLKGRPIVVMLCYDRDLRLLSRPGKYSKLVDAAAAAGVKIHVCDASSLRKIGVRA